MGWFAKDWLEIELTSRYTGRRNDFSGVALGGYTLFDINFITTLSQRWSLNFFVGNLLDKEYEDVSTYGTMGRNFKLSVTGTF